MDEGRYDDSVDMWSFGVTCIGLSTMLLHDWQPITASLLLLLFAKRTESPIRPYQNKAKNLYTIDFVFDFDSECKFIKQQRRQNKTFL